jgi:hypothetical protein
MYHDDLDASVDGLSAASSWIETHWMGGRAGQGGHSMMQVDCYTRQVNDPYGKVVEDLADAFVAKLESVEGCLPVYDWAVPTTPSITSDYLQVYGNGQNAHPEERVRLDDHENSLRRVTMRFLVRLTADAGEHLAYKSSL